MSNRTTKQVVPVAKVVRCAVYTRKSTEEGLEQAFNSLDAQRESAEAFIAAQKHEGWTVLPDRYDDGGFSGGNMDRPALKRLLADVEQGKVDAIVVYKVDRLSRSLLDFARIMQVFDAKNVSFVSVTQQFNTAHSMGRLTLNILLSFAQFEREIISERTRDKIAGARRKGKYAGGRPILGYDVVSSPAGTRLVVNEDEAYRVRAIYDLYLEHQALTPTLKAIQTKGWTNKGWVTRKGTEAGGNAFDKCTLYKLLTNKTYTGVVVHGEQSYPGEHEAIVTPAKFDKVAAILSRNGGTAGAAVKNRYGAILKGLIHCSCCRCSMGHSYTMKFAAGVATTVVAGAVVKSLSPKSQTVVVQNATYYYADGVYYQQGPQGYVVIPAPSGAVINDLPPGAVSIVYGGTTYYYSGGVFYSKKDASFLVVNTPIGITVSQLPPGANQTQVNGESYFLYNGIYYKPAFQSGVTVYTTVKL